MTAEPITRNALARILSGAGRAIDVGLAPIFPGWAFRRSRSRLAMQAMHVRTEMLSTYAGAKRTRDDPDWKPQHKSGDQAIIPDTPELNARARALARDNWAAESSSAAFRRHVVGIGITPRSAVRDPRTGEDNKEFNQAADRLWRRWAQTPGFCDIERRKTFVEIQGLAIEEMFNVGQAMIILTYVPRRSMVGLTLQMIEPEQLNTGVSFNETTENRIRHGVEIDKYGAPVAYHIHTTDHPLEKYGAESTRIPAARVLHLMRQRRVRQTMGVTWLAAVMKKIRMLSQYDEAEQLAKLMEACIGGVWNGAGSMNLPGIGTKGLAGETGLDTKGNQEVNFEPGMLLQAPPGREFKLINPQRPGSQYQPYMATQTNHIGAAVHLDSATLTRDFQGSYSSRREGSLERDKETDPLQQLMMDLMLRPARDDFIRLAVLEGRLDAPGFFSDPEVQAMYLAAEWQAPPKPWIDPARRALANKLGIEYRWLTRQAIANELGQDATEILHQFHDLQVIATDLDVYLPDAQPKSAPSKAPPPSEPNPVKDDEGDSQQSQSADQDDNLISDAMIQAAIAPELAAATAEE